VTCFPQQSEEGTVSLGVCGLLQRAVSQRWGEIADARQREGVGNFSSRRRCELIVYFYVYFYRLSSIIAGFGLHRELFIETSGQSTQPTFQPKPAALDGKSRQLLDGVFESLQSVRCLNLQ
jgi:hypothetical protein